MNTIHLTTLTDRNFVIPTIVMMTSAQESMAAGSRYYFHLFHSNLEPWQIKAFQRLVTPRFTISIRQLQAEDNKFSHLPNCGRHGQPALMRLYLPNLLPEIDKVIYLDGDIIVTKDLVELYNTPLGDNLLAAVKEPEGPNPVKYHENIPSNSYFNTGVMVLDLARMRDENLIQQFIDNAPTVIQFWQCADQDIINYTCANRIHPLHPRYNYLPDLFKWQPELTLDDFNLAHMTNYADIAEVEADSAIIHIAGSQDRRPWQRCNGTFSPLWLNYFLRSPLKRCNLLLKDPHQDATNRLSMQYLELKKEIREDHSIIVYLQTQADRLSETHDCLLAQIDRLTEAQMQLSSRTAQYEKVNQTLERSLIQSREECGILRKQIEKLSQEHRMLEDAQQQLGNTQCKLGESLQSLRTPNHTLHLGFGRRLPVLTIVSYYNRTTRSVKKCIKLLGFIPFITAKGSPLKLHWRLFNVIPIWRSQTSKPPQNNIM